MVAGGDTFTALAKNDPTDGCFAAPAVVVRALIVRTKTALYRLEE